MKPECYYFAPVQPLRHYIIHIIVGASTGCGVTLLLIVFGLMCIICKLCKKRGRNEQTHITELYSDSEFQCKLGDVDQDTCIPQYDTINPIYENLMIPESLDHSQNFLKMMNNDAYSKTVKYTP